MITYRAALEEDVVPATEVFVEGVQDLVRRNGLPPLDITLESRLPWYSYIFKTGFFRVAEQDGKIVALANGIVRGPQWFLSGFWVKPGLQKSGVGGPLLRQAWNEGPKEKARVDFTWSSIDFAAMASYFKLGMLPRCQILTLTAPAKDLRPAVRSSFRVEPIAGVEAVLELDRELRGAERREDLAYLVREGARVFQAVGPKGTAGYFFVKDGSVGPAGWSRREDGAAITRLALEEAAREKKEVRLMLPGINHEALRAGLEAGLRLAGTAHLLASDPIGSTERYLPSGGLLF